jgi:hypothetical protein
MTATTRCVQPRWASNERVSDEAAETARRSIDHSEVHLGNEART